MEENYCLNKNIKWYKKGVWIYMLYAIDSITKSKIEVVSKEDMNTYIEQQVSSILSGGVIFIRS